ncbi:polyamine ABC transporter permease [Prosthecomicrobium hirschii]|jgi:putative spermidine/putrescine transport system permease protein|uniref:Polyamine ABC transporter permease n=1 Tax=Prosthecodimorpha hirschii TaxID=665126 RepID=A0A0P6WFU2_9HYPH|nr:ABC transporter permease [Prosthecomicrobium hirschii]KPL53510.1 polyamine ABC transporter permease [Prosthecomicrobium hirschii]TPQ48944.1 ABC transporter permease [Prosthecomicrobium hirschii]
MALPSYASRGERLTHAAYLGFCVLVFVFLVTPILVIVPLSFSSEPWFTYPLPGLSLRWYEDFFGNERWVVAIKNSAIVGFASTLLATTLGTLAALGLSRGNLPYRGLIMSILISPMVVPVVITAVAMYFAYALVGLNNSYLGLILAHTALSTPFVVITVTATLTGFDRSLTRAAASLGAAPWTVFRIVTLPIIAPGVVSGALFAFVTSWDEVVVALFLASPEQRTLPRQMFSGIREQISPTITAAATFLIVFAALLMTTLELLRRRSERLARGR